MTEIPFRLESLLPSEPEGDGELPYDCATAALYLSGILDYEPKLSLGGNSFFELCNYVDEKLTIVGESDVYDLNLANQAVMISCKYRPKGTSEGFLHGHFAAISKVNPEYLLQRPAYNSKREVIHGNTVLQQLGRGSEKLDIKIVYFKK